MPVVYVPPPVKMLSPVLSEDVWMGQFDIQFSKSPTVCRLLFVSPRKQNGTQGHSEASVASSGPLFSQIQSQQPALEDTAVDADEAASTCVS